MVNIGDKINKNKNINANSVSTCLSWKQIWYLQHKY